MSRRKLLVDLACVGLALFALPSAFAQFEKANQEYGAGQFKEAIADYEALVQKQQYSANLFYDLGNAYFRAGDFGKAILNYERALALDRHHPEAATNLRMARDEARALELLPTAAERYLQFGSINQLTMAAAIAFWVLLFSVAILIFSRRRTLGGMTLSILSLSILLACVAAIYLNEKGNKGRALAIVTTRGLEARVATADTANRVLALPPGSEIRFVSKRGDWIYSELPNNLRGWIPANSAESVRL